MNHPTFLCNCRLLFHANYLWLNLCEILLTGPHSLIDVVSLSFSDFPISLYSSLVQTWQFEHKQPEVLICLSHTALFPRKPIQTSLYHKFSSPLLPQLQPLPKAYFLHSFLLPSSFKMLPKNCTSFSFHLNLFYQKQCLSLSSLNSSLALFKSFIVIPVHISLPFFSFCVSLC